MRIIKRTTGPAEPAPSPQPEIFKDLLPDKFAVRSWRGKAAIIVAASACILLGLISSLIPVIPGFVLIIVGVLLLGMVNRRFRAMINAADRMLPPRLRQGSRHCQRSARAGRAIFHRRWRRVARPKRVPASVQGRRRGQREEPEASPATTSGRPKGDSVAP